MGARWERLMNGHSPLLIVLLLAVLLVAAFAFWRHFNRL